MRIEAELDDIHAGRLLELQKRVNKPLPNLVTEILAKAIVLVPKLCLGTRVLEALLPDASPVSGKQSLPDCIPKRSLGTRRNEKNRWISQKTLAHLTLGLPPSPLLCPHAFFLSFSSLYLPCRLSVCRAFSHRSGL